MSDQLMSPKQAADFLSVKANALKKYSLLLEAKGYNISRNELNYRMFSGQDLAMIRAMLILNRLKSVQLEDAASIVTSADTDIADILAMDDTYNGEHDVSHTDVLPVTQSHVPAITAQVAEYITALQTELQARDALHVEFMAAIDDKLAAQADIMNEQAKVTAQLLSQNEALLAKLEALEKESKRTIWSRLFGK